MIFAIVGAGIVMVFLNKIIPASFTRMLVAAVVGGVFGAIGYFIETKIIKK
jgi:hypothetical protein